MRNRVQTAVPEYDAVGRNYTPEVWRAYPFGFSCSFG